MSLSMRHPGGLQVADGGSCWLQTHHPHSCLSAYVALGHPGLSALPAFLRSLHSLHNFYLQNPSYSRLLRFSAITLHYAFHPLPTTVATSHMPVDCTTDTGTACWHLQSKVCLGGLRATASPESNTRRDKDIYNACCGGEKKKKKKKKKGGGGRGRSTETFPQVVAFVGSTQPCLKHRCTREGQRGRKRTGMRLRGNVYGSASVPLPRAALGLEASKMQNPAQKSHSCCTTPLYRDHPRVSASTHWARTTLFSLESHGKAAPASEQGAQAKIRDKFVSTQQEDSAAMRIPWALEHSTASTLAQRQCAGGGCVHVSPEGPSKKVPRSV
ncbi:uncharacterized protein LOC116652440 [Coturnix japonica]|uniref:uncharacterized protein LOC116652440 n=1 Tax=Coturnix japonica TaxID=93934 RepID=UPI0013A5F1F7|nr:uncharacterized protein LOC116652440 [Coturnix japonica]